MQKKLLAVAVLSAFSGLAAAQSANVTLYGTLLGDVQVMGATGGDTTGAAAAAAGLATPAGANSSFRNPAFGVGTAAVGTNLGFNYLNTTAGVPSSLSQPANQSARLRMNPAGSNFGIRGTEDLGNGLSAWFQIEMAATLGGPATFASGSHGNAPSFRNSAVGLRSNTWGTALMGSWDLPFNVAYTRASTSARAAVPGTTTTGSLMGNTFLGQGTVSSQDESVACSTALGGATATAAGCFQFGTSFDRREKGTLQWWSPNWNGFDARVAYSTPGNFIQADNRVATGKLVPNIWDLSLGYTNGGLDVVVAYERQKDILANAATISGAAAATGGFTSGVGNGAWKIQSTATTAALAPAVDAVTGSQATGYRLGAKYAFSNGFAIGGLWESLKWTMTYTGNGTVQAVANLNEIKKTAWKIGGSYTFGNHFVGLDYYKANNLNGSLGNGPAASSFDGSGTGARQWIAMYNYMLSKRTSIGGYYNRVNNDTNASYGGQGFAATSTAAGQTATTYGFSLRHSF